MRPFTSIPTSSRPLRRAFAASREESTAPLCASNQSTRSRGGGAPWKTGAQLKPSKPEGMGNPASPRIVGATSRFEAGASTVVPGRIFPSQAIPRAMRSVGS